MKIIVGSHQVQAVKVSSKMRDYAKRLFNMADEIFSVMKDADDLEAGLDWANNLIKTLNKKMDKELNQRYSDL